MFSQWYFAKPHLKQLLLLMDLYLVNKRNESNGSYYA